MTQTPALAEARVIDGKYRVEERLGEGATGVVYHVTHLGLGRAFALKELKAPYDFESQAFQRFRREAEALGRLQHPNIVDDTDFGVDAAGGGRSYLVMELIEGETLAERLRAPHASS